MHKARTAILNICLFIFSIFVCVLSLEIALRYIYPVPMLTPRYDYSEQIGIIPFANVKMKHRLWGEEPLIYTTNAERYRGPLHQFDSDKKSIVVLGDSHSFGIGVNDHATYSNVLDELLAQYRVVNLSSPGFGLTHQINRYLSIGEKYKPQIVLLQFCANDPIDSLREQSVIWNEQSEEFQLQKVGGTNLHQAKVLLNHIQPIVDFLSGHSAIYNLIKHPIYAFIKGKRNSTDKVSSSDAQINNLSSFYSVEAENNYINLLNRFAKYLSKDKIKLIMFSVQDHLKMFPELQLEINRLNNDGLISYIESSDWFSVDFTNENKLSPHVGHFWGELSHKWIALKMAEYINERILKKPFDWTNSIMRADLVLWCANNDCKGS